ncbi:hypothetical protein PVAND_005300 [Polypedilum vanderplanki]|uniref:BTB domain-containing protein n=1 Tax=Polypedilum vanderplanki TaxID=319348 RepID=A0A9J6C0F5_POLVA|nr:hypothetical protein PVAND_005300 [Polypedilum vanderplanki]
MEEFALCWNKLKFAENLSTGFQSLYDRGDFVDCTIACDGQLLQCHKLVLAICSPYFREIFMNNPCRHPIIILKDVTYSIMSELLQFMYQGEVNVKQAELQAFMSIAESLQIKGLATNTTSSNNNNSTGSSSNSIMKGNDPMSSSYSQFHSNNGNANGNVGAGVQRNHNQHQFNSGGNHTDNHRQTTSTPLSTTSSIDGNHHATTTVKGGIKIGVEHSSTAAASTSTSPYSQKRTIDQISEQQQQRQNQMKIKRANHDISDSDMNDSIDNMTSDDIFLPAMQPHVTINESPRFDANSVKRESVETRPQSPSSVYRNSYHNSNVMQNTSFPYFSDFSSSDLSISNNNNGNDMNKSHMDVPPGTHNANLSNVTMLSATSLLHNSMIFNRNNTVATQQGMKTYWLCRSYRITTCRARCITHQGQLISTTGQHNHPPHVKSATTSTVTASMGSTSGQDAYSQQQHQMTMMNQQQQQQFAMPTATATNNNGNNFSMTNILGTSLNDIDASSLMQTVSTTTATSSSANQLNSNIQITPIINASIDDLQMHSLEHHHDDIGNAMNTSNMHNIAITSANN